MLARAGDPPGPGPAADGVVAGRLDVGDATSGVASASGDAAPEGPAADAGVAVEAGAAVVAVAAPPARGRGVRTGVAGITGSGSRAQPWASRPAPANTASANP